MLCDLQVEFYILEYADALAASHLTWPLAAEYLAWCPVHGQSSLIRLLESLPLATSPDRMAMKAVQVSPCHCYFCNYPITEGKTACSLQSQHYPCSAHSYGTEHMLMQKSAPYLDEIFTKATPF